MNPLFPQLQTAISSGGDEEVSVLRHVIDTPYGGLVSLSSSSLVLSFIIIILFFKFIFNLLIIIIIIIIIIISSITII